MEHFQDPGGLAALAATGGSLGGLRALGRFLGGLAFFPAFPLAGATAGFCGAAVAFLLAFGCGLVALGSWAALVSSEVACSSVVEVERLYKNERRRTVPTRFR